MDLLLGLEPRCPELFLRPGGGALRLFEVPAESRKGQASVAHQSHLCRVALPHLLRIDVDLDEGLGRAEAPGPGHGEGEARAHGQYDIGLGSQPLGGSEGGVAGAHGQGVVLRYGPLALRGGDDGCAKQLRDRCKLLSGVGANGPATGPDEYPACVRQKLPRVRQGLRTGDRRCMGVGSFAACGCGCGEDVGGKLQLHRPRPSRAQLLEGPANRARYAVRVHYPVAPLGQRAEDLQLVVHLVQDTASASQVACADLPGDEEDGRRGGVGGAQGARGVEGAGARHHQGDARSPRRPRVAVGHVRGGLLVPHVDDADLRVAVQSVEDGHYLDAGKPEDRIHPVGDQGLHEGLSATDLCHSSPRLPCAALTGHPCRCYDEMTLSFAGLKPLHA